MTTNPTRPAETVVVPREAIARIIDPDAWHFYDRHINTPSMGAECRFEVRVSLDRADAILALADRALATREDAQPVAWRWRWRSVGHGVPNDWRYGAPSHPNQEVQPLYTHPSPDALRVAREALASAVWALGSFGQLAADEPGGNTEGLNDEVVVRMRFPDPEYDGEETALGDLFIRAFRKARDAEATCRAALTALSASEAEG
ncbi:hypothetical protein [uncultured Brevundimonas sp.]|uniref:hypothetical protein n=1 Tax=uncultured Brevundimonas sp. TaxID=213418 RepID=UPI002636FC23|nr:hypothetical protein [uncultured Brevundimonas sp.]